MQETVILGFDPLTERAVTLTQKSDRLLCDRKNNNLWVQRYIVYIHLGGWVWKLEKTPTYQQPKKNHRQNP